MKKVIAILLTLVMVIGLAACGTASDGKSDPTAASPSAAASPETTASPSSDPAPAASADASVIGTAQDPVDNFAREPYTMALISYEFNNSLCASINTALTTLAPAYNVELVSNAVVDGDGVMNALETYAMMKYDGYIIILQDEFVPRLMSEVEELGIENAWIAALNPCMPDGKTIAHPGVSQSASKHGAMVVDWCFDNYKEKLGDIDLAKVGHIICSYSKVNDFLDRDAAIYAELDKNGVSKDAVFYADTAVGGFSSQTAVDMISATLSAHASEYDYWFIYGTCDDFGLGGGIAVTTMGISDKTLVACIQGDQIVAKWETGDQTGVDCAIYMSSYMYALPMLTGIIALCDGRATWDTLWPDYKADGNAAASYGVSGEYITFNDYNDVINGINEYIRSLGVDI